MENQIELSAAHTKAIEQVGDALANFLTVAMRDLTPAAVAEMNAKLAAGTGFFRLTTEVAGAGMRVAAAFVTEQNTVPILDIRIGNADEELGNSEAKPWKLH